MRRRGTVAIRDSIRPICRINGMCLEVMINKLFDAVIEIIDK